MKKILALYITIAMALALFTGCTGTTVVIGECTCPCVTEDAVPAVTAEPSPAPEAPAQEGSVEIAAELVKTGLSVSTGIKESVSATAEAAGEAKYDVTLAAVTVDDSGVIRSCVIDSIPASVMFDATGAITSDLTAAVQTKNELGVNYGMSKLSAIGEWDEQVKAVADYAVGKTVDELKNGDIDMTTGKATDGSDLQSSATIYLADYVYAIEAAVNNAQHLGAKAGDELVLTTMNTVKNSTPADAENAGNAQLDADIVALTRNAGQQITSCYIDSLQAKIAFDATGAITTDLTAPVQTKNELGEAYGMVAIAYAKAEWNEQAASFAKYITGMTADEVAGIAITETTKPADGSDLASSVTIAIGGFQALIAKAMQL